MVVFPKGDQDIGFTIEQMDEFYHFREALHLMSRAHYILLGLIWL